MERLHLFLLFTAAALWSTAYGQELNKLNTIFQQHQANADALANYKNSDWKELEDALDAMNNLWTVYFPKLLQDSNSGLTEECRNSTEEIYSDEPQIHIPLSLKYEGVSIFDHNITIPGAFIPMLDATGKQGAGLFTGNLILDGAYDECFSLDYTGYCLAEHINLTDRVPLPAYAQAMIWTMGFCVPKGCTPHDVSLLVNSTMLFQTNEDTIACSDSKYPTWSVGAIIMLFVCSVFILLVLIGSAIDCAMEHAPQCLEKKQYQVSSINNNESSEESPLLTHSVVQRAEKKFKVNPVKFITAFSLFKTVPTLLATKQVPSVITSLNGLRVISMFWVILGHTHFWTFTFRSVRIDNIVSLQSVASRFSFQALTSAFFSVDSFFFLSGVLVAYLTLRQMKKRKGRFPFLEFYIHRYLRLTPTYAFVLFFAWFITAHLAHGPVLSLHEQYGPNCEKYWWTNFLYINNLYPWGLAKGCVSWTWYLANDMQFYIISPLILIPAYFLLPAGFIVLLVFLIGSLVVTSALTAVYDFQANTFSGLAYGYIGKPTTMMNYSDTIYIKPWNRLAPYLVGVALGYIFYRGFNFNKLNRLVKLVIYMAMWCVAGFAMFWLVYGLYFTWHGHRPGKFENNIYITFSRFIWALCLALIVYACHNGYGWFVNSFLSMPIWTPLSRMTLNAYLVHPIVMTVVYGQLQTTIHYTDITMAVFAIVFVVLAYAVAGVVCLFVEFPLGTIEMLIFKLVGLEGRMSQRQGDVNMSSTSRGRSPLKETHA